MIVEISVLDYDCIKNGEKIELTVGAKNRKIMTIWANSDKVSTIPISYEKLNTQTFMERRRKK